VLPQLPDAFLCDVVTMRPVKGAEKKQWILSNEKGFIVYTSGNEPIKLDLSQGKFVFSWIDPDTGKFSSEDKEVEGGRMQQFSATKFPAVLWIRSK